MVGTCPQPILLQEEEEPVEAVLQDVHAVVVLLGGGPSETWYDYDTAMAALMVTGSTIRQPMNWLYLP